MKIAALRICFGADGASLSTFAFYRAGNGSEQVMVALALLLCASRSTAQGRRRPCIAQSLEHSYLSAPQLMCCHSTPHPHQHTAAASRRCPPRRWHARWKTWVGRLFSAHSKKPVDKVEPAEATPILFSRRAKMKIFLREGSQVMTRHSMTLKFR